MINVFQPSLGREELQAIAEVFSDNWPGHGVRTAAFEKEFAEHIGVPGESVLFLNNATAGLFLAMELLELEPGDEVVLPSVSFVSAANAIAATGAVPVFCDVDPYTLNPAVEDVERALTPRTRAVCVLHYGGYPGRSHVLRNCAEAAEFRCWRMRPVASPPAWKAGPAAHSENWRPGVSTP